MIAMTLVTVIDWDTEGETLEECLLPSTVLAIGTDDADTIGEQLSEQFGFCHHGFKLEPFVVSKHATHAGGGFFPDTLGVLTWHRH